MTPLKKKTKKTKAFVWSFMFTTPHVKKDQTHTAMAHMKNEGTVGKKKPLWCVVSLRLES